ncbi:MAG: hypothetical protein JNJ54_30060 [Myxococcaceae bacterium]|nr:hypothetical protein [Myxococcaceae bacterium]
MPTVKNPNANVSGALLKALSTKGSTKQPSPISNKEWSDIKKAAVSELRTSKKPTATLSEVKTSFDMANRLTEGKYKKQFGELAGELTSEAKKRQEKLKQLDTSNWGVSTGGGRGRNTGVSTGGGRGRNTGVSTGGRRPAPAPRGSTT